MPSRRKGAKKSGQSLPPIELEKVKTYKQNNLNLSKLLRENGHTLAKHSHFTQYVQKTINQTRKILQEAEKLVCNDKHRPVSFNDASKWSCWA